MAKPIDSEKQSVHRTQSFEQELPQKTSVLQRFKLLQLNDERGLRKATSLPEVVSHLTNSPPSSPEHGRQRTFSKEIPHQELLSNLTNTVKEAVDTATDTTCLFRDDSPFTGYLNQFVTLHCTHWIDGIIKKGNISKILKEAYKLDPHQKKEESAPRREELADRLFKAIDENVLYSINKSKDHAMPKLMTSLFQEMHTKAKEKFPDKALDRMIISVLYLRVLFPALIKLTGDPDEKSACAKINQLVMNSIMDTRISLPMFSIHLLISD